MKPLSLATPGASNHAAGSTLSESVCCRTNPVEGDGQETATVFVVVRATVSDGRTDYLMIK